MQTQNFQIGIFAIKHIAEMLQLTPVKTSDKKKNDFMERSIVRPNLSDVGENNEGDLKAKM